NARLCHPPGGEEHLLPLMVAAGAADQSVGRRIYSEHVMQTTISAYRFGRSRPALQEHSMIIDLSGKTAVITGSTGGIGLAIATGLANAGASVVIVGREQARIDTALTHLRKTTGRDDAAGVECDPGTAQGCEALIAAYPDADIL